MHLRAVLEDKGIDIDDVLARVGDANNWRSTTREQMIPLYYVTDMFSWGAQREGWFEWNAIDDLWTSYGDKRERWPELEAALGWVDPLEYELMEVKGEAP